MSKLYVINLHPNTTKQDIELEFQPYGKIRSVLRIHHYAVVEFIDSLDALFALCYWNNPEFNWRIQLGREPNCHCSYPKIIKREELNWRGSTKEDEVASTSIEKLVPSPPHPPWIELPEDVTSKILHKLGPIGMLWIAQRVCTTWRKICRDPTMWRVVDMSKLADVCEIYDFPHGGIEDLCCLVADLSQGYVTEINIDEFSYMHLIQHITDRCGQLKCLLIASCYGICFKSLCKGLPLLEELHLQYTVIDKDGIEAIGQFCPMLKTFAMNGHKSKNGAVKVNEGALAIAEYMPELRHLQLIGNKMTNETLEAILNGCPKLESLDLQQCYNLDLEGELGKRCAKQVKILRRSHDSIDDYEFDIELPNKYDFFFDFNYDERDYI